MRRKSCGNWPVYLSAVLVAGGTAFAAYAQQEAVQDPLAACKSIDKGIERLACYDKLAGRTQTQSAPRVAAPVEDFGLTAQQKQRTSPADAATPETQTQIARISALRTASDGHVRLTLENGQVWEFDDGPDDLMSAGDSITIRRASLGSFLLLTPSKRSHRVRRIK